MVGEGPCNTNEVILITLGSGPCVQNHVGFVSSGDEKIPGLCILGKGGRCVGMGRREEAQGSRGGDVAQPLQWTLVP